MMTRDEQIEALAWRMLHAFDDSINPTDVWTVCAAIAIELAEATRDGLCLAVHAASSKKLSDELRTMPLPISDECGGVMDD